MLTGKDLLAKVKELGDVSKSDLVRACGYVSTKKGGGERLNFTAFYEALLEAKGVNLASEATGGVGSVAIWGLVDDSQTVTWSAVDDSQTVTWTAVNDSQTCLLYTSPSPRDRQKSRMPSSA